MAVDPLRISDINLLEDLSRQHNKESEYLNHILWAHNALARHYCFIEKDYSNSIVHLKKALTMVPKIIELSLKDSTFQDTVQVPRVEKLAAVFLIMLNFARISGYEGNSSACLEQLNELKSFLSHPGGEGFKSYSTQAQEIFANHWRDLEICLSEEFLEYLEEKITQVQERQNRKMS